MEISPWLLGKLLATLAATLVLAKLITKFMQKVLARTKMPRELASRVVGALKYTVYLGGFLAMLSFLGIDLTAFLMSIGALSIAISFATKDIISNLISGMILYADRPFRIGDVIQVKDCKGRVVRIGVRSTLLETKEGELITIPNSIFLANPVRKLKA